MLLSQLQRPLATLLATFVDHLIFLSFFNHPATTEFYTLSLHDALPIWPCTASGCPAWTGGARWARCPAASSRGSRQPRPWRPLRRCCCSGEDARVAASVRAEEHTSEPQLRLQLVCRLHGELS